MAPRKPKVRKVVRDSKTGEFLPKRAAKRRPSTTTTETVRVRRVRKKK